MVQSPRFTDPGRVKLYSVLGVSVLILLLDSFFMYYATTHGFTVKTQPVSLGGISFQFPLQVLPVVGVFLVAVVAWYEVAEQIFPRRSGPETDPLAKARALRVVFFSLAAFVIVLYLPYLLGSGRFWDWMSSLTGHVSQLRDSALSLLHTVEPLRLLDPLIQYSLVQLLATAAMVTVAWVFGRGPRRVRKLR
jgi:hypothetical protein